MNISKNENQDVFLIEKMKAKKMMKIKIIKKMN